MKMSTQKGNNSRSRSQKHQNRTAFKNNLHDTSHQTKFINSIVVSDVCQRCKEIIDWKIKYKKYKPLTQPKKCVKCEQKTVRRAYHVMCLDCGKKLKLCTKCCQSKEIIPEPVDKQEEVRLDSEMQALLQSLPERKRRTFIRYMNRKTKENTETSLKEQKDDLVDKLSALKANGDSDLDGLSSEDSFDSSDDLE